MCFKTPGCFQIPQYLHEAGWTKNGFVVGITQPRRMAATTVSRFEMQHISIASLPVRLLFLLPQVASRVADERGAVLGHEVRLFC